MDRRFFILPVISVALVMVLLSRTGITGFMTAGPSAPSGSQIAANISVTIAGDGFIPEDAIVTVYLDERSASMGFGEFVARTGAGYSRVREEVPKINYDGYGYGGPYRYALDISAFGIDASVAKGSHKLVVEVSYGSYVISRSVQDIEVY